MVLLFSSSRKKEQDATGWMSTVSVSIEPTEFFFKCFLEEKLSSSM